MDAFLFNMEKLNLKPWIIAIGLLAFVTTLLLAPKDDASETTFWYALALGALMVTFWLFDVIPIYVTALLPFVFGVPLGVLESSDLTAAYGHKYIYLYCLSIY